MHLEWSAGVGGRGLGVSRLRVGAAEREERTVCAEFESVIVTCVMLASQICDLVFPRVSQRAHESARTTSRGASSERGLKRMLT